jgi:hypothetical protein
MITMKVAQEEGGAEPSVPNLVQNQHRIVIEELQAM